MKLTYRTIVWSIGLMFIYTVILSNISSWFKPYWSYMKWYALFGDIIALLIGFYLDQHIGNEEVNTK
jgi:hypothetical protein